MSLEDAVARATGHAVLSLRRVGGGDINDAFAVELEGAGRAFVKTRADAPAGEYAGEAAALRWLGEPGGLGVPEVLGASDEVLVLEWLDEGPAGDEALLGRGLAIVHAAGAPAYGGSPVDHDSSPAAALEAAAPLRIGPLVLPNDPSPDWPSFYAERRLLPLVSLARDRGALSSGGVAAVERVCERMPELVGPPELPARLHGDLWTGNVLWSGGRPSVIDPIAYGGHREVDLAMLRLFSSPGPRLIAAYEEVAPLAAGHEDRVALWQLFPLLVHAVLFGGSYGSSVERAARRY